MLLCSSLLLFTVQSIGIHYGVTFFVLEKLAAVVGVSNLHVYAAMRGQSLEEFQATRNAKIEYGVGVKRG